MEVFKGMIQRPICWSDRMVTERAGGKMGEVWRRIYLGGNPDPLPSLSTPLSPRRRTPPPLPSLASLHSIESDQRSKITLGCWTSEMIQLSKFNFLSFGRFCNRFTGFKKTLTLQMRDLNKRQKGVDIIVIDSEEEKGWMIETDEGKF